VVLLVSVIYTHDTSQDPLNECNTHHVKSQTKSAPTRTPHPAPNNAHLQQRFIDTIMQLCHLLDVATGQGVCYITQLLTK
jgi:hypothetical protein